MNIGDISGNNRPYGTGPRPAGRVEPASAAKSAGNDARPNGDAGRSPEARALVPVAPKGAGDAPARMARPANAAGFIAQLIATSIGVEQTRVRRRATPADSQAAYRATRAAVYAGTHRTLGRKLRQSA